MSGLKDKVVLITGAGKGAGRTLAEAFAREDARVAANDLSPINLDALVQAAAGRVRAYPEDIAKKVGVQAVINQVEDDWGRIDVLINHAAVAPHYPLLEMDEWDWHRVLDVNLTGAFLTLQSVGRVMRQSGSGVMLNLVGLDSEGGMPAAAYSASMFGLVALTRAAAVEMQPYGISVNAVGHGLREFQRAAPAVPRDLIGAVFYLCQSDLTGQIVNVEVS